MKLTNTLGSLLGSLLPLLVACGGTSSLTGGTTGAGASTSSSSSTSSGTGGEKTTSSSSGDAQSSSSSSSTGGSTTTSSSSASTSGSGGAGGSGPACTPTATVLATATNVGDVAVNATDVFYSINNQVEPSPPGSIMRVSRKGGQPVLVASSPRPYGLILTSTSVIFGDQGSGIFSAPLAGGPVTALASTNGAPTRVQTDGKNLYFGDMDGTKSVPIGGGNPTLVTTVEPFSLTPAGQTLVLADFSNDIIVSVPITGGQPTTLASNQDAPVYPISDGQNLYWLNAGDLSTQSGALMMLAPGGSPVTLASGQPLFHPQSLLFDGAFFYTATDATHALLKVPAAGGTPVSIAALGGAGALAMDSTCIYAADPMQGIVTVAK